MENSKELKAFIITTSNNTYSTDQYVVIAYSYAEAEDVYWKELNGHHEILSIKTILDIKEVGFRADFKG